MQHDVADRSRRAERSRSSLALARRLLKAKIPVRVCVCMRAFMHVEDLRAVRCGVPRYIDIRSVRARAFARRQTISDHTHFSHFRFFEFCACSGSTPRASGRSHTHHPNWARELAASSSQPLPPMPPPPLCE